jgi:hypothetical protein
VAFRKKLLTMKSARVAERKRRAKTKRNTKSIRTNTNTAGNMPDMLTVMTVKRTDIINTAFRKSVIDLTNLTARVVKCQVWIHRNRKGRGLAVEVPADIVRAPSIDIEVLEDTVQVL